MNKMRVVLDTSVLVAASRSRPGASFALLQVLREGRYQALASLPLMLEYQAVLNPEHLAIGGRDSRMTDAFLDALSLYIKPVHLHYLWRPQLRDPADEMVLETALNGRAEALITLNIGDFAAIATRFNIRIITPGAFWHSLKKGKTNDSIRLARS